MLTKYDLIRLHRIAYLFGKQYSNSSDENQKKFFRNRVIQQEDIILNQFDYRWYEIDKDWFPSYEEIKTNQILNSDHSVTLNCFIILHKSKNYIPVKLIIYPNDTIKISDDNCTYYDIKDVKAYYIIPRYIPEY